MRPDNCFPSGVTFPEVFSAAKKVWLYAVIICLLAGVAVYKYGPPHWHKMGFKTPAQADSKPVFQNSIATNAAGNKLCNRDLGILTLTNGQDRCISLPGGANCRLTPNMIDRHDVQLTLTVESKQSNGKLHDLCITQVITRSGEPFVLTVGDYNFSLTPNVISE